MKYCILSLLSFPFLSFAQKSTLHPCAEAKIKHGSHVKSNTFSIAQIAETEKYDVHYYFLDLNMTNTSTDLSGNAEIHAHARETLDSALLEFFPSYTITALEVDGVPVSYNWDNTALKVPVNKNSGENFVVKVTYNGTPPNQTSNPLGGSGITNDNSPSWGNQVTWSLSEAFVAYEWFPVKQSLKDKADSSAVWLTVPTACKGGSNGTLEQVVDLGNGTHRFEWKNHHVIDYYLISVAVAEYVEYTITANPSNSQPVLIQNFIYNNPATLPNFQAEIDETADYLELFAELFGPYPYADEKYGHCMAPLGGGMEHQTMTTQGYFDRGLTDHELAHQWFGDHVTCESWADIWVNEGFASYAEYIMLENLYPGDELQDMLDRHDNIMSLPGGSVWVEDSLNDGAIFSGRLVYNKGASIVHTMRFLIDSDSAFFTGLQNYQQIYADSTASGPELVAVMEDASGVDLSAYLQEWYYGEGYPKYGVRWNNIGNDVIVEINEQTSKPTVTPLFTNDLELTFDRNGAPDTIIRFPITSNQNQFILSNMANVINITKIDPNNWICNQSLGIVKDVNFTVGIAEAAQQELMTVSPNPTNGPVTVQMNVPGTYELVVVDSRGKVVEIRNFTNSIEINLSNSASGTYMLQVKGLNNDLKLRKVIKH